MLFGYARVSTQEQRLDLQLDALRKYGVPEENIFYEKTTGMKKERPELNELLKRLRKDDTLVVWKLDRIGRSTKHLVELITGFNEKGINFVSLNESIDTTTAVGKLIFSIFSALAQFERDVISERTIAGLQSARARGKKGGRPKLPDNKIKVALKMYESKDYPISQIIDTVGISKTTLYKYLNNQNKGWYDIIEY